MLTRISRLSFKRDYRLIVRCLSDKPSDNDGKAPPNKKEAPQPEKLSAEASKEKIQALLKSMLTAPRTESEHQFTVAPERPSRRKQKADEIEARTEKIEENLTKAAGEVAKTLGGDIKHTEAELLSRVLGKINQTSTSLSDLLIGMKVDRSKETDDLTSKETRGQQVKRFVTKSRHETDQRTTRFAQRKSQALDRPVTDRISTKSASQPTKVDIFSGEPLGIFKAKEPNYGTKLDVWEELKQRELALATSQPPTNYFQKMVMWTEQGKVWKFPVDNEQGWEEEQNVHFSEHIFLDAHLEGWCPKKGPIRHFMELVCVGLSKNAFYTVQEKKDHIMWYKEYFESKKDLLTDVGAWDVKPSSSEASTTT